MKIAIIGGSGKMGQWFTKFFLKEGIDVVITDKNRRKLRKIGKELGVKIAENTEALRKSDTVLISVPIENFEEVVKEIRPLIRKDQVVMDITSIKEFPVKIMHRHIKDATILGTHPMFGPATKDIKNRNFILTPTNPKEKKFAGEFKKWLEKRGVNVVIMSPRKHDELMSVVLAFPHLVGIAAYKTLLKSDLKELKKVGGPSFNLLLKLAESVISEDPKFYASIQMNLPKVVETEALFYKKFKELSELVKNKNLKKFVEKMKQLKK